MSYTYTGKGPFLPVFRTNREGVQGSQDVIYRPLHTQAYQMLIMRAFPGVNSCAKISERVGSDFVPSRGLSNTLLR